MTADNTQASTEIEPMVPIMPTERTRADGGEVGAATASAPRPGRSRPAQPVDTTYASPYTRDEAEIEPLVEDLR